MWPRSLRFAVNDPGLAAASLTVTVTVTDPLTDISISKSVVVRSTGVAGWRIAAPIKIDSGPGTFSVSVANEGGWPWRIDDVYLSEMGLENGMPFKPR